MVEPAARRLDTYSKGMRQRVKIAAALVHQPSVLLLDEPFNGVDPRQRMHLMDLLRRLGDDGRTVLFSSHILEEVERLARHIEVVVSGRHAGTALLYLVTTIVGALLAVRVTVTATRGLITWRSR